MKKITLLAAVISLALVSCKKDWTCSCKTLTKTKGLSDVVVDEKYTITEASRRTAYNHCTHKYMEQKDSNGNVIWSEDENCSLE